MNTPHLNESVMTGTFAVSAALLIGDQCYYLLRDAGDHEALRRKMIAYSLEQADDEVMDMSEKLAA